MLFSQIGYKLFDVLQQWLDLLKYSSEGGGLDSTSYNAEKPEMSAFISYMFRMKWLPTGNMS